MHRGSDTLGAIAVGGGYVYVADPAKSVIVECSLTAPVCQNIGLGMTVTAMSFDGTYLWATGNQGSSGGLIYRCSSDGSCKSLVGIGNTLAGIASDGTNVYFAAGAGAGVMRCSAPDCGTMTDIVYVAPGAAGVAVDANAVYWVDSEGVRKIAK